MPSKEKNNMLRFTVLLVCSLLVLSSCKTEGTHSESPEINDSLSKAQQKIHNDSLKSKNPLLILPPDSSYTGDYIDKYPSGVIKFRGQFRFGQRHGHWLSFYPNGELWSEMHYDKGLREGPNATKYENGGTRYEGFFKNDLQDSIWNYYDEKGVLVEKVLYKKDRIVKKLPLK
jgi:antitoxin component YwqK of YwqJK toxin-antitoxin module